MTPFTGPLTGIGDVQGDFRERCTEDGFKVEFLVLDKEEFGRSGGARSDSRPPESCRVC